MSKIWRNEPKRRVFAAVDITTEARVRVGAYIEELKQSFPGHRVGWERPEKLHLTVKFIGDTVKSDVEKIMEIAGRVANDLPKFTLSVESAGVFPSPKKGRILWLGIRDKTETLLKIKSLLEAECEAIGIERDRKAPKPHLTIARIKESGAKAMPLIARHLESKFEPVKFEVSEIVIYESRLFTTGSEYSVISKHTLK